MSDAPAVAEAAASASAASQPAPEPPPLTRRELLILHGGLVLTNVIWSIMHVVMAVPLRRGANAAVLSVYRELIGAAALSSAAYALERDALPAQWTQDKRLLRLLATAGFIFAAIRLSILSALANAGPDITAAITPVTPVATLVIALVTRVETLDVRSWPGAAQLSGLLLCSLSSVLMGVVRGPLLFGTPPQGEHAPTHVARGVAWMLVNTLLSAVVQIVNKQTLAIFPTISMTAAVAAFAVLFLIPAAVFIAPSPAAWVPDGVMLGACLYTGLMATGVNNVLLSRVNRRLGPTAANLYMPLQPLTTAFIDWMTLGDAFYVANLVCGIGITAGLVLAVGGRQLAGAAASSEQGRQRAEERAGLLDGDALQLGERTARVAAV